ncbi:hypothetical protein HAV15_000847 [Penicillium sp. str. |nr:hypothetical protein HAV15_000847 [Penicillium sp. str. \
MIAGANFLLFDDYYVKELGIKAIAHRQYLMLAIKWLQRRSLKFQAQRQQEEQAPKALPSEDELSPEPPLDVIDPNTSLDNPISPTTPDDATNLNPLHDALPPAQTEGKKPRRMETTIIERPPPSSLLEPPSTHQQPAPNPIFGNDSFFDHLMKTYPPNDADVLSLLGESSSEGEYDTETREEMEEDERQFRLDIPPDTSGTLRDAEFNEIVDEYIHSRKAQFIEIRLPKEQPKGFQIWVSGQKFPSMKSQISTRLVHLEKRCQALRKALAEAQHSSRSSLVQACACLDPTVIDICLDQWKLSVLEKASPPAKVARPPRTPRPEKPKVNSDGEETLSSDSDSIHDTEEENMSSDWDFVHDTDGPAEQSEHSIRLAFSSDPEDSSDLEDNEENEALQDQEEPGSREAHQYGPFHDSSSDEDLGHLFYEEEKYEPPAAKRRRLKENSVHQDNQTSPLMPMATLPTDQGVVLPSKECEAEGQTEANTDPVNPVRLNTHEPADLASDNGSETDDAVCVFDNVYPMMWATIEESGNRIHLVAKALTGLPKIRLTQLSKFLGSYMPCVYREYTRDALNHMSDDSSVIEGMDPEESHSAMLMTALFVSWINVIQVPQVPHGAFTAKEVKAALMAIGEDLDEDQFQTFFECLNDLLKGYRKWLTLSPRLKPHKQSPTGHQTSKRKRQMILTRAQEEGQHRKNQQDQDKRILLESQSSTTLKPVSFQEPVIYLDPYIGKYVKEHQLSGIQFMFREIIQNNREEGCLLAHTMGLGKSMQVISLLVTITAAGASQDPAIRDQIPNELRVSKTLLLCPAALIQNWRDEFALWSPRNHKLGKIWSIPAKSQTVDRTGEIGAWNNEGGILILSYNIFRNIVKDKAEKNEEQAQQLVNENVKRWVLDGPTLVVVDEAQNLRNHESQIAEAASRLRTRKRIALTGTPISNSLEDYYWMVDWVAPQYLGTFADFNDKFIKTIENGSHIGSSRAERREALQRQELFLAIINPKVQRMDMSALTAELPRKYEFSIYFEPTKFQKTVYNLFVDDLIKGKCKVVSTKLMSFLNLLQLCCIHPALFKVQLETRDVKNGSLHQQSPSNDEHSTHLGLNMPTQEKVPPSVMSSEMESLLNGVPDLLDPSLSSRVAILNEIVNQAIALGDKVLVFSSSIPTLHYLAELMGRAQMNYCLIEGNVGPAGRPERIDIFNNDPKTHVCLISTRAGGVGLNIQGANRVVIFDFLFNPTWEAQATGRAYRIGQKKPVYVYRMIAGGTFEEKLHAKNLFKSQLAYRIVDQKNLVRKGSKYEDPYLVHCTTSSQSGGIDELALAQDPEMMNRLGSSECARFILAVKLSAEEVDPEDRLTVSERQSVEDELRLRRMQITSVDG